VNSARTGDALSGMLAVGKFEPYIRHIRFPRFRNLRDGTRIDFGYPVTALVGPNGTNKTAILRALQGCPDQENIGRYWFSTSLDPIGPDDRHRFVHGYYAQSVGEVVEVVKTRAERRDDPDYFETARPIIRDGMAPMPKLAPGEPVPEDRTRTRWKAIRKNVVYVDFRSRLSAFDRFFYHVPLGKQVTTLAEKKEFIRRRAGHLARSMHGRAAHSYYGTERILESARQLNGAQVEAVSRILGRQYEAITVLAHQYFGFEGWSVLLHASDLNYSEAFAGSGEFAVVMLVKAVTEAPPCSLILLDEPEISLHPGAQLQLMSFIETEAKAGLHQFVLSTHSPEIVRGLPAEAIKVFQASPADGRIELISQRSDPAEAFFRLGVPSPDGRVVYVEDVLARAIVERAVSVVLGEAAHARVRVEALPGGASAIQVRMIPALALSGTECLVLLDGDQRRVLPASVDDICDSALRDTAKDLLGGMPQLSLDGGPAGHSEQQERTQLRTVIEWVRTHVAYLPGADPESLLLALEGKQAPPGGAQGAKREWTRRTRAALGAKEWEDVTAGDILSEERRALAAVSDDSAEFREISDRIREFLR
jgi:hypothetical protein